MTEIGNINLLGKWQLRRANIDERVKTRWILRQMGCEDVL
jgi:hypothetical protein